MQTHPGVMLGGQTAQRIDQFGHASANRPTVPKACAVLHIDPIGRSVLTDHQQFFHTRREQRTRLAQDLSDRARHQIAPHRWDDAEGTAMVAALADFEIGVMLGREFDARWRHEIDKGIVRLGQDGVHMLQHLVGRVRPGNGEHLGVHFAHQVVARGRIVARAQAAGHDHFAVFGQGLADGVETFLYCGVDEAASVDDDQIRPRITLGGVISLCAQFGQDALGIHQRLGAAERDKTDFWRRGCGRRCWREGCFHPDIVAEARRIYSHPLSSPEASFLGRRRLKGAQHLLGLLLHLFLHLHVEVLALLEVIAHHVLQHRALHVEKLGPRLGVDGCVVIHAARLLGELVLNVDERLHILFQIAAHHALHGVAVEADDLLKHDRAEHGHAAALFFQNDLQQDAAGEIFAGLGVLHHKAHPVHHQLFDIA